MTTDDPPAVVGAAWQATAWHCGACGHCNLRADTCEACGVARRFLTDPPLDIPRQPALTDLPSFWIGLCWGAAALAGVAALLSPGLRASLSVTFLGLEVLAAGAACLSSLLTASWERAFNQLEVVAPPHAASGSPIDVTVRLVPYTGLERVSVAVALVDRHYRRRHRELELASHRLERRELLTSGRLPGRRVTELSASFLAPYPVTAHTDVQAEIMADVLGFAGFFVPALRAAATNLREHGGYYLEVRVRCGLLSRRVHRRVVTYALGNEIYFG